jgi:hypothetical protein
MKWRLLDPVVEAVKGELFGRPNLRQLYTRIAPGDAPTPGLAGELFVPGKSYFTIRLVELRLAVAGRYLRDYLPMCTCFVTHRYGETRRTVPFVAGPDLIRKRLGDASKDVGKRIEFQDMGVVANVPVPGDDVEVYVALCRFTDNRVVSGLLNVVTQTAQSVGGAAAGAAAKAATGIADGLMKVMQVEGVETRFGRVIGDAMKSSGYWLLAGSESPSLKRDALEMRDSQLINVENGKAHTIDDADYLVVGFEHRETLVDEAFAHVEGLGFHAQWKKAAQAIVHARGASDAANDAMAELQAALLLSPDVTEADRLPLMQMYDVKRMQLESRFKPSGKSGVENQLLIAVSQRAQSEKSANSDIWPLLQGVEEAMVEQAGISFPDDGELPSSHDLASTFKRIREKQLDAISKSDIGTIAAATRAYAGSSSAR